MGGAAGRARGDGFIGGRVAVTDPRYLSAPGGDAIGAGTEAGGGSGPVLLAKPDLSRMGSGDVGNMACVGGRLGV